MAPKRIALIICSTRNPRVCPSIAPWITSLIPTSPNVSLTTVDLFDHPMPISPSGATIPAKLKVPLEENPYEDEEVNIWSRTVRSFDAFIFLMPQYNWSFPASIKIALDHLFHEWAGRAMLVVSYGGHGGFKGAAHLKDVWRGLRAGECVGAVELALGGGEGMGRAQKEGVLDEGIRKSWEDAGKDGEVTNAWALLIKAVEGRS